MWASQWVHGVPALSKCVEFHETHTARGRLVMKRSFVAGLPLVLWVSTASAANDQDKTLSPYFFVEGAQGGVDAFPLKSTKVSAAVSGVIADVVVRQVYENNGSTALHVRYVFPAST